ncbi:MAG: hypothetical protein DCC68_13370 [Planctomycetota bacterium]|nr:MAG: hypothetical protein DCC68_13370 [Planctomycetota bacterium]
MVICDAVHRDRTTGKFTILGTFNNINASEFPCCAGFCIYFAFTDGVGRVPLRLRIAESSGDIAETDTFDKTIHLPDLEFPDPLTTVEGFCILAKIELPKPGVYHCELYSGDEHLMARRLRLTDARRHDGDGTSEGNE